MTDPKKIAPPAPLQLRSPSRVVAVPPTVGRYDTTEGDSIPLGKTRADFREEEFTRVIRQHGKHVVWRKAMYCPCNNIETQNALVDCPDCNGIGWIYVHPLTIQTWMAQFDSKISVYEKFGLWQEASVSITTEAKHRLGYRDSLEMLDSVNPFVDIITKGNRHGVRYVLPDSVDSARFRISHMVSMVTRRGESIIFLEEGTHFTITQEGWIKWTAAGNRAAAEGAIISLKYLHHPIFIVQSWFHIQRDDTSGRKSSTKRIVSNPVQALAKMSFLVDPNHVPSMQPDSVSLPSGVPNSTKPPA